MIRRSAWSQRMIVAECLAVASIANDEPELDVPAGELTSAFAEAWSRWPQRRHFPSLRPDDLVEIMDGPRSVPDAIAHWHTERPFRASLTRPYTRPADVEQLIAEYTGTPLPRWQELASMLRDSVARARTEATD